MDYEYRELVREIRDALVETVDDAEKLVASGIEGNERKIAYALGEINALRMVFPAGISPAVNKRIHALMKLQARR